MKLFASLALAGALILAPTVAASATVDEPGGPDASAIMDRANVLSPADEKALLDTFVEVYRDSDLVPVLETVNTLNGEDAEGYALERANELGVGEAEKNNGLFILFVKGDRYFYMQPGRGVQDVVPQDEIQNIVDSEALPRFKDGDFLGGIQESTKSVAYLYANPSDSGVTTDYSDEGEAASPVELPGIFKWVFGILGGTFALALGALGANSFVNARRSRREREAKALHDSTLAAAIKEATHAVGDSAFLKLPDEASRRSDLATALRPFTSAYPMEEEALAEALFANVYVPALQDVDYMIKPQDVRWAKDSSLEAMAAAASTEAVARMERERVAAEARAKAEEEARIQRERDEQEARDAWDALSESDRRALMESRNKKDRLRVLQNSNTSMDANAMLGFLIATSIISSNQSASYTSSSSSSSLFSSDYSSFNNSSFDGGSFGGGGDGGGGGGGGSW